MKQKYDVIFSVGGACACSEGLRFANLQLASFPLDWIAGSDIRTRVNLLTDDLGDLLQPDLMRHIEELDIEKAYLYRNVKYTFNFPHDFPRGTVFEEQIGKVREKYMRRMRRLDALVAAARRVLFVWVDVPSSPQASDEDIAYCRDKLAARWPGAEFDAVVFQMDEDTPYRNRVVVRKPHLTTVRFAYRDQGYVGTGWRADHDILADWLRKNYAVADYRSEAERQRWNAFLAQRKYGRFKTDNPVVFFWRSVEYRIYKHFRKRLERKGVI